MKRSIFGAVLLLVLLGVSLYACNVMSDAHQPGVPLLREAAQSSMEGDWIGAENSAAEAWARWQKYRKVTAALADHTPMEDVESLFAELSVYFEQRDNTHFAATARTLAVRLDAMSDAHIAAWWNLL